MGVAGGVPVAEATAKDFMQVRAALVRRLGGANEALVWTRIDWRADSARVAHQTEDGTHWWAASHREIAEETGLSPDQVARAIKKLVERGFLREDKHHGFDRRGSYSPIYAHSADSPNGEIAASIPRDRQMHSADSPDVPLIETSDTGDTPVVPKGDDVDEVLGVIWHLWPTPRRGTTKVARAKLAAARKAVPLPIVLEAVRRDVAVWRSWPPQDVQYIPLLTTWLNQGRWEPQAAAQPRQGRVSTVDAGRAADAILAQHERRSVSA